MLWYGQALPSPTCSATNTCTYSYAYGDSSSTRGDLAFDTVTLNSAVSHIGIGCGHNQQGTFSGADGLVGLGRGSLSLPSQLSPAVAKIFSYCLVEQTISNAAASSPITFGNAAENSAATYTPLLTNGQNPSFYYVGVSGISVGSTRVSIPTSAFAFQSSGDGGVILDSGTTLTYWRTAAFDPILAVIFHTFPSTHVFPNFTSMDGFLRWFYDVGHVFERVKMVRWVPVGWSCVRNLWVTGLQTADCVSRDKCGPLRSESLLRYFRRWSIDLDFSWDGGALDELRFRHSDDESVCVGGQLRADRLSGDGTEWSVLYHRQHSAAEQPHCVWRSEPAHRLPSSWLFCSGVITFKIDNRPLMAGDNLQMLTLFRTSEQEV